MDDQFAFVLRHLETQLLSPALLAAAEGRFITGGATMPTLTLESISVSLVL